MVHGPAFSGNQAPRQNYSQNRPAIGSSPTFSRPSYPNNGPRAGANPNLGQNLNQGVRNPGNQLNPGQNRPNNPNLPNQNLANRPNFPNRGGNNQNPNPNQVTVNRPNFNPNGGNRDQNNFNRNQNNFDRNQNQFNRNQTNVNADRRFNNQNQVNNNSYYNHNRNYPNHWAPYQHSGWKVGYWNPGYNMGYGRGGFGTGLATGVGLGALGYGGYGGYGGLGYGGYGGYGNGGYGGYGGYGPYGYGGYGNNWGMLAGLGLASWAMGPSYYGLGYGSYSNPYYASNYGGYNYAQPIPYTYSNYYVDNSSVTDTSPTTVATTDTTSTTNANAQAADELLASARTEFKNGNYEQALTLVDQAITKTPEDTLLHEFRGLTLFAIKRYPESAAAIYAVLSISPGWNWSTLSSLYPSVDVYTAQLRALEAEVKGQPEVASTHFLLGYHYLTTGHSDAAQRQFAQASTLSPNDQTSAQLAKALTPASAPTADAMASNTPAAANPQPNPPVDQTPAVDDKPAPNINGQWTASAQGNDSIKLELKDDKTFTWTLNRDGKEMKHEGQFEQQGDNLILDFKEGGGMVAKVTKSDNGFHFVIVNGPPNDPGLNFRQG